MEVLIGKYREITDKRSMFHCYVWIPEGKIRSDIGELWNIYETMGTWMNTSCFQPVIGEWKPSYFSRTSYPTLRLYSFDQACIWSVWSWPAYCKQNVFFGRISHFLTSHLYLFMKWYTIVGDHAIAATCSYLEMPCSRSRWDCWVDNTPYWKTV